jgi:hypothetical protein
MQQRAKTQCIYTPRKRSTNTREGNKLVEMRLNDKGCRPIRVECEMVAPLGRSARDHCLFYPNWDLHFHQSLPSSSLIFVAHSCSSSKELCTPTHLVNKMASTMSGTTFANSNSSFRVSQSHATPSYSYSDDPSTQLPSVDFNFEDLRQRMAAFTVKFDAFIEKGRKRVLEDRNEFRGRLSELGGMYTFPSVRSRNTRGLPETGSRQALADPAAWAYFDDRHRTLDLEQLDSTQAAQHNLKHHKANEMQSSSARQPGSVTTHDYKSGKIEVRMWVSLLRHRVICFNVCAGAVSRRAKCGLGPLLLYP